LRKTFRETDLISKSTALKPKDLNKEEPAAQPEEEVFDESLSIEDVYLNLIPAQESLKLEGL